MAFFFQDRIPDRNFPCISIVMQPGDQSRQAVVISLRFVAGVNQYHPALRCGGSKDCPGLNPFCR